MVNLLLSRIARQRGANEYKMVNLHYHGVDKIANAKLRHAFISFICTHAYIFKYKC